MTASAQRGDFCRHVRLAAAAFLLITAYSVTSKLVQDRLAHDWVHSVLHVVSAAAAIYAGWLARSLRPARLLTLMIGVQTAQRDADVDALDALLHPRVVGAGPDGGVFGKEDDLESYRSGALRITRLVEESVEVKDDGRTGTTRIVAAVEAVQSGTEVSAWLRYTRLWLRDEERWRVLAATVTPVQP